MPDPHTSSDVIAMLRRHYLPENREPGGIFAPEIQSPDGRRRADLLWLSTTTAGGKQLVGHEVKVSRADVLVELQEPAKAEPWSQFCDRWWLVVSDPTLVDGLDIPEAWGIMAPPSGRRTRSMTVLRKAPPLQPRDQAPGVKRIAAWVSHRHNNLAATHRQELSWRDREIARLREQLADRELGRAPSPQIKRVQTIIAAVDEAARDQQVWERLDDEVLIEALVDLRMTQKRARDLTRYISSARESLAHASAAVARCPEMVTVDV